MSTAQENWKKKVLKEISKKPERKEKFELDSGIEVDRLYFPKATDEQYEEKLGYPGEYPYTRGVYPTMYRGKLWTMRQYAGFATAEESNKRYRMLLDKGTTGLSVAFDLPTQMGYDSDHPMARGEVGKVGVAIDTLADMETLFDNIPLEKVSTSMTINATAAILLAMYCAVAKKQGADLKKLSGTIQNDLLKEYIARGTYIYPPAASMKIITDIFAWCASEVPSWNTISISGYHIREAGSTAVQEVAFTLANAIAYVESAIAAGLDIDDFAPRLAFFFNAHNNLFEEVAKFRAARRLYAKIMRERFGSKSEKSWTLRFHTQTAGCTLQAQQPYVNLLRVTVQALSAVLGGTQSLHTNSFDEALALPTDESVTLALRTQQVLGYESGVTETIDPLAGSYYVEALTDEIERRAAEYIKKIDEMGGSVKAIERGFFQDEIATASYAYQQAIEHNEKIVVGVNQYREKERALPPVLKVTEEQELRQVDRCKQTKTTRDNNAVTERLAKISQVALTDENIIPHIVAAVEVYASVGEISDALRKVYGEY